MNTPYDAFLLVSFGGPEGSDEVLPFLENVVRGRNVPRERLLEVAQHYEHFGGVSPINQQNRELIEALQSAFPRHGIELPIYWGNRNWNPLLADTMAQMKADGVRRAIAFVTSAFSCYSGCRQYREDITRAQQAVGDGAPQVDKMRVFFNHPGFIRAMTERVQEGLQTVAAGREPRLLFTAHSIPAGMASGCSYESQLREASRLVAENCKVADWELVYQSRSGPPQQPWLEPDVLDHIQAIASTNGREQHLLIAPIGFVSDHLEVKYDLDTEALELCRELGMSMTRVPTVGTHRTFVEMICQLIAERSQPEMERMAIGNLPPAPHVCPEDCCLYPVRRPTT